jgi:restriction system protein
MSDLPNFQDFFLPVLKILSNGKAMSTSDVYEKIPDAMKLSAAAMAETIPSRNESRWHDRTMFSFTYLFKAGLLSRPAKGVYKITEEGLKAIKTFPNGITVKDLYDHYPSFKKFRIDSAESAGKKSAAKKEEDPEENEKTPAELLGDSFSNYKVAKKDELIQSILDKKDPEFFEHLVLSLLHQMGYGVPIHTGKTGDGGKDGIVIADSLGLNSVVVQAKCYALDHSVQVEELRAFITTVGLGKKGVFFTTSRYTSGCYEELKKHDSNQVILIDGEKLADLMYDYGVGVQLKGSYEVKDIDEDFFSGDGTL